MSKVIYLIICFLCLGLGCIGIVLPILPTVPFFMGTVLCFAKSSRKLHSWFLGTKLYQKYLQSFMEKRGMLFKTKITIMITVTLMMGFGFCMIMSRNILIPCIILAVVWICHIVYFVFGVKTLKCNDEKIE